jgi:aspartate/methionine/tyrosine aminotransferase
MKRMRLSPNVSTLQPSATIAVATLCRELRAEGRDIIDLSVGEPDFRTPDFAAQAGIAAIVQGFTHYTPVAGLPELREAIADSMSRLTGAVVDPAGIVVSNGAKQALFNACFALFGPGDEVLLPAPYWTSYPDLISLARATPVVVHTTMEQGFKVTPEMLDAARTPRTRGLILNSPGNPTGAVYAPEEVLAIVEWARRNDAVVISDEIYGRICFVQERAASVLDVTEVDDNVVVVDGASKAFAMTGWRVGFSYSTRPLASAMAAMQSHITSNISTPSQYAALAAYRDEPRVEHAVRAMVNVFRRRRAKALEMIAAHLPGAEVLPPAGAFYAFLRVDRFYDEQTRDSIALCRKLLEETGVAAVPGAAFGDDRYIRLSLAAPEADIAEAIRRMASALSTTPAGRST